VAKYCKVDYTKQKYTGKASGMQMRITNVLVGKVKVRLIYSSLMVYLTMLSIRNIASKDCNTELKIMWEEAVLV